MPLWPWGGVWGGGDLAQKRPSSKTGSGSPEHLPSIIIALGVAQQGPSVNIYPVSTVRASSLSPCNGSRGQEGQAQEGGVSVPSAGGRKP